MSDLDTPKPSRRATRDAAGGLRRASVEYADTADVGEVGRASRRRKADRGRAGGAAPLLWRSLLGELLRLLALTAGALVVVISFAATVKPLADGDIGIGTAVVVMGVLAVPMLQFALPFSAGFAATLAYHRFAADREATAAAAGGISYRSILVPAVVLAVALAITVGLLSNTIIPRFLESAERLVARDVSRLIAGPLSRGETLVINDWEITAERVTELVPAEDSGVIGHIVLDRALLAKAPTSAPARRPSSDDPQAGSAAVGVARQASQISPFLTAERIDLILVGVDSADGGTDVDVSVWVSNAVGLLPSDGETRLWADPGQERLPEPLRVPSAFDDDPKYLTLGELLGATHAPRSFSTVDRRARTLESLLERQRVVNELSIRAQGGASIVLKRSQMTVRIRASSIEVSADEIILGGAGDRPVVIEQDDPVSVGLVEHRAARARLVFSDGGTLASNLGFINERRGDGTSTVQIDLVMEDVTTSRTGSGGEPAQQRELPLAGLRMVDDGSAPQRRTVGELLALAETAVPVGSPLEADVRRAARQVRDRVERLEREITAKIHERFAFTVASGLMVLIGAVMALRLRDSLPLPVYLWSFLPALTAVVTISSGQTVVQNYGSVGLVVLWGGVAGLAAFAARQYSVLRRH